MRDVTTAPGMSPPAITPAAAPRRRASQSSHKRRPVALTFIVPRIVRLHWSHSKRTVSPSAGTCLPQA
jgi:hypothetical protein